MVPLELFLGFFVSLFAGVIGSMVGIGGGVINTPYISIFNNIPAQISSTSLMSVLSTSISSTFFYLQKKLVKSKIGIVLAVSAIPGTYFGVIIAKLMSINDFKILFALVLIATSIYLIIKTKIYNINSINKKEVYDDNIKKFSLDKVKYFLLILFAFFAGIVSSSFGVGGGIIFVPCLVIICGYKMNVAAATSQFALMFTSFSGLIFYLYQGIPDYPLGIVLSMGSVIGGFLGVKISTKVNPSLLQKVFSIVLILVSLKLLYDGFT